MDIMTARTTMEIAVALVFFRHLQGAARAFHIVVEEGTPRALRLIPVATGIAIYRVFAGPFRPVFIVPGAVALIASLLLFEWAKHSIRGKFFSYAMSRDTPDFLWTSGPYAYVRNPFYVSYLLAYFAVAILFLEVTTVAVFAAMIFFFTRTAQHEERKFQGSTLAEEYEKYCRRTGRFIPKLRALWKTDSAEKT